VGTTGANTLNGVAGADIFFGLAGNDTINTNGGDDVLVGGTGNDTLNGGAGNDTFLYTMGDGADTMVGGTGTDKLSVTGTAAAETMTVVTAGGVITTFQGGSVSSIEQIVADLLGGADTLSYTNNTLTNGVNVNLALGTATGFTSIAGIENVTGGAGNDTFTGDARLNVFNGGAGNDTFFGSAGGDTYSGGAGTDKLDMSFATQSMTINLNGSGSGADIGNITLSNIEIVKGGSGKDTLIGTGGADTFIGSAGGDSYTGGGGTDTLDLSATTQGVTVNLANGTATGAEIGNSTLASIEAIIGGSGNDTIIAGLAPEFLTGGLGADTFVFNTTGAAGNGAGSRTQILDFLHLTDIIDVVGIDASSSVAGDQAFIFDAVAHTATGQVTAGHLGFFVQTIGGVQHTILEGNIAGLGGNVDFQIDLTGNIVLTAQDFHL
jgi:Ca2+-binding RTX toxin-like protein